MKIQLLNENHSGYGMLVENSNSTCAVRKVLNEANGNIMEFLINGIYMQGDIQNRNGRIYPFTNVLLPEVQRYIAEVVNMNKAGMELNHPDSLELDLERTCGRTKRLWWEDNNILGESVIGNHGVGALVQDLFNMGFEIGVSSRGTGTVGNDKKVEEDFRLYYIDVVFQPSAPDAIVHAITNESADLIYKEGLLSEQEIEGFKNALKTINPKDRVALYNTIINKING